MSMQARYCLTRGLVAAAAAFVLSAGPAVAQEPIKIGAFLSITGPASFLGDPENKTLELYVGKNQRRRRRAGPQVAVGFIR